MKSLSMCALSLALLVSQAGAMESAPAAPVAKTAKASAEGFKLGAKVGELVGKVKANLPSMPARPTTEQIKEFAKANPVKAVVYGTAVVAAVAAVVYTVYKACTAKKAKNTKVVVAKTK